MAPDPSFSIEDRLLWYDTFSGILFRNVSESYRLHAAAAADKRVATVKR